jgi:2-isopropylmalate synthase
MAGADRVEGCLFGNGERTGNVDLVTLALNLYTQGVSPELDFSDLEGAIDTVAKCHDIPIHPRAPWSGSLVFTAFSGSHQDAIKKSMLGAKTRPSWAVPYLPLDPADIGQTYDALVRINSQSGSSGVSYLVQRALGIEMPKKMQIAFYRLVQGLSEVTSKEILPEDIETTFRHSYFLGPNTHNRFDLIDYDFSKKTFKGHIKIDGVETVLIGTGNGPVSSLLDALKSAGLLPEDGLDVQELAEHSIGSGKETRAAAYVQVVDGAKRATWGVGIDEDVTAATLKAVLSAVCGAIEPSVERKKAVELAVLGSRV